MEWSDGLTRVTLSDGRQLIGASFRGVPFFVAESDRSGGRRVGSHEFIDSDYPAFDDLGRAIKVFRVQGYVLGENYLAQRDNLLRALEDVAGPGELIHPFYGRKRAVCGPVSVRESTVDGGIAYFSIEFSEAPDTIAPSEVKNLAASVDTWGAAALEASQTEFTASYDVSGQPSFATQSLRDELTGLSDAMLDAMSPIIETTQELALLHVAVDVITAQAATLIRTPADVINALLEAFTQLEDSLLVSPRAMLEALLTTYGTDPVDLVLGETATRIQERLNQAALADALRRGLIIHAATLLNDVEFDAIDDAIATRDTIVDALDELAQTAGSTSYPALISLRSAVVQAVPGDATLARVRTVSNKTALPSILMSYKLYGSQDKEADLIARNGVQNPGFITGDVEALSFG